jgi:hypothetical protein
MPQQFPDGVQRNACHDQPAGEAMSHIVPTKMRNACGFQKPSPGFPDIIKLSPRPRKYQVVSSGLVSPGV